MNDKRVSSYLIDNQVSSHGHVDTLDLGTSLLVEDSEGGLARVPGALYGPLAVGLRHPHVLQQLHIAVPNIAARRDQHAEAAVHLERGEVVRHLAHRYHHDLLDV